MNEKQRRFAEYYAANPNAAKAAKAAGYSEKTARAQGQRLLTKVDIISYMHELQDKLSTGRVSTMEEVKAFWSSIIQSSQEKTADRLKASELFAKAAGAFIHCQDKNGDEWNCIAGENEGEDVIIYLPEIEQEREASTAEKRNAEE